MWPNDVFFAYSCWHFLKKTARESKKPAYCTDSSLRGPFFSSHPVPKYVFTRVNIKTYL